MLVVQYAVKERQKEVKPHHQDKPIVLNSHAIVIILNSNYCGHLH